ncbi:hypothetical protein AB0M19_36020 [Streptomyces sp. NPDC051920]|uniref:hypothetical protein n=1 Tax=Streptomyces sp. NPDC051920 TaxID=3155523 RepID=UPI003433F302
MADTFNYRIDHHGSLVRPAGLTNPGEDPGALDDAVGEAVALQRRVRSTVVTDGGFPYEDFRGAVLGAVSGFRRTGDTGPDGLAHRVDGDRGQGVPALPGLPRRHHLRPRPRGLGRSVLGP